MEIISSIIKLHLIAIILREQLFLFYILSIEWINIRLEFTLPGYKMQRQSKRIIFHVAILKSIWSHTSNLKICLWKKEERPLFRNTRIISELYFIIILSIND